MVSDRDQLLSLRPAIPSIMDQDCSRAEQFQNRTLRPILKFQNELLLAVFRQYLDKRKRTFYQLSAAKRLEYIAHAVRQDQNFKHCLLGMVLGQLTLEEWQTYQQNEKELRRRTTNLLVQRLQDQVALFV
ncbi:MAG: glyoxalase [Bacteroidota bacterium]